MSLHNRLITLVVAALGNGHGFAAVQNGLRCGQVAVKADEDGVGVGWAVCRRAGRCDSTVIVVAGDDGDALRETLSTSSVKETRRN